MSEYSADTDRKRMSFDEFMRNKSMTQAQKDRMDPSSRFYGLSDEEAQALVAKEAQDKAQKKDVARLSSIERKRVYKQNIADLTAKYNKDKADLKAKYEKEEYGSAEATV